MSRRAQRAKRVPSKRKDKFKSPRRAKTGPNWPVIIVVVAAVVVVSRRYRREEPITDAHHTIGRP